MLSIKAKTIASFLEPLYLIRVWQSSSRNAIREVLIAALAIASIPAAISFPFIFRNAEGSLKSILFSTTRYLEAHDGVRRVSGAGGLLGSERPRDSRESRSWVAEYTQWSPA